MYDTTLGFLNGAGRVEMDVENRSKNTEPRKGTISLVFLWFRVSESMLTSLPESFYL